MSPDTRIPESSSGIQQPRRRRPSIAQRALSQVAQAVRDVRQSSGVTIHNFGSGNVQTGVWTYTTASKSLTRNSGGAREALEEGGGRGEKDESERGRGLTFIVSGEPTIAPDPGE